MAKKNLTWISWASKLRHCSLERESVEREIQKNPTEDFQDYYKTRHSCEKATKKNRIWQLDICPRSWFVGDWMMTNQTQPGFGWGRTVLLSVDFQKFQLLNHRRVFLLGSSTWRMHCGWRQKTLYWQKPLSLKAPAQSPFAKPPHWLPLRRRGWVYIHQTSEANRILVECSSSPINLSCDL